MRRPEQAVTECSYVHLATQPDVLMGGLLPRGQAFAPQSCTHGPLRLSMRSCSRLMGGSGCLLLFHAWQEYVMRCRETVPKVSCSHCLVVA